jgi:hypothetical protein
MKVVRPAVIVVVLFAVLGTLLLASSMLFPRMCGRVVRWSSVTGIVQEERYFMGVRYKTINRETISWVADKSTRIGSDDESWRLSSEDSILRPFRNQDRMLEYSRYIDYLYEDGTLNESEIQSARNCLRAGDYECLYRYARKVSSN